MQVRPCDLCCTIALNLMIAINSTTIVDGKFTALFEEHEHKWFVDKVLSWMDLSEFLRMMRAASASRRDTSRMSRK